MLSSAASSAHHTLRWRMPGPSQGTSASSTDDSSRQGPQAPKPRRTVRRRSLPQTDTSPHATFDTVTSSYVSVIKNEPISSGSRTQGHERALRLLVHFEDPRQVRGSTVIRRPLRASSVLAHNLQPISTSHCPSATIQSKSLGLQASSTPRLLACRIQDSSTSYL